MVVASGDDEVGSYPEDDGHKDDMKGSGRVIHQNASSMSVRRHSTVRCTHSGQARHINLTDHEVMSWRLVLSEWVWMSRSRKANP